MSNVTFRGVILEYADLRRKEVSVFARAHFTADWTKPVADVFEWEEIPSSVTSAKLDGSLTSDKFILTPTDKKLRDWEFELQCSRVEDFTIVRITKDEKTITRLRFTAMVEAQGGVGLIEAWMRSVGEAPAALKVTYVEQTELDLEKGDDIRATPEQQAAAMEMEDD